MSSSALSAETINKLVKDAVKLYRQTVRLYLEAAMQDGYLPLTTPPKNRQEELALLESREAVLWEQAMTPTSSAAVRSQAQRELHRLSELRHGVSAPG